MKQCVFSDNAEFVKIWLCRRIFNLILKNFNSWPQPCLLLNVVQKMWKQIIKSCSCVPLRQPRGFFRGQLVTGPSTTLTAGELHEQVFVVRSPVYCASVRDYICTVSPRLLYANMTRESSPPPPPAGSRGEARPPGTTARLRLIVWQKVTVKVASIGAVHMSRCLINLSWSETGTVFR